MPPSVPAAEGGTLCALPASALEPDTALVVADYNVFYECVYGKRSTHEDDDAMSSSLAELDIVIGCAAKERKWIPDQSIGWGSDFLLSGMDVGSKRRAWRFTPSLPIPFGRNIPNITNITRWDPRVLVSDHNAAYLALGPLTIDHDEHLLETCTITFEQCQLNDIIINYACWCNFNTVIIEPIATLCDNTIGQYKCTVCSIACCV